MDQPVERAASATATGPTGRLDAATFASEFRAAARVLWCIGVAVHGDRTLADDTLQEAAVIALGKLDQFDPSSSFIAWMGQIVRFVALNQARRVVRNPVSSVDPVAMEQRATQRESSNLPVNAAGELAADQTEFDDRLAAALRLLDADARCCLLLRTILNLPYQDISRALDIPEGTAMSHVHRARKFLREQLQDAYASLAHGGKRDE
jgi:RNA polymerase sigma-70 factor (ECF subfamily)